VHPVGARVDVVLVGPCSRTYATGTVLAVDPAARSCTVKVDPGATDLRLTPLTFTYAMWEDGGSFVTVIDPDDDPLTW